MLRLDLTEEEHQILADLLEERIDELRLEVADTKRAEYRAMLKHREAVLRRLLTTLRAVPVD